MVDGDQIRRYTECCERVALCGAVLFIGGESPCPIISPVMKGSDMQRNSGWR